MVKIGIVGVGCVGEAVYRSIRVKLEEAKTGKSTDTVVAYDKYKNIGSFDEILTTDIALLCLPTPYSNEIGAYDLGPINDVCQELSENNYQGLVVVKSTVEPTTCDTLSDTYNLSICHNPEFLSAKTAYEDFHCQEHIVLGYTHTTKRDLLIMLIDFYNKYYPAKLTLLTARESEAMKIFCNTFYAIKIQAFNEMYLLCKKLDIDFNNVRTAMLSNGWINPMHTTVPGHDGSLSYGGMCFPKDTNALLSFMQRQKIPAAVIEATIKEHDTMRPDQHRFEDLVDGKHMNSVKGNLSCVNI